MLTVNFDPFPALETGRLVLRQITDEDIPVLFFLRSHEEVMKYIGRPRPQNTEELIPFIEKIKTMIASNEGVTWAVSLKDDPKMIGHISFHRIIKEHHRAEVGYMLHPELNRKGIMDEALKAVLHYGFHTMRLHSVEANVHPENIASRKLLEKNGFVCEAHFKEDFYWDGQFLDTVIYSLLTPVK